jgi:hypothetical protein
MPIEGFFPGKNDWSSVPISTLGLTIKGTPLEPLLAEFARELERVGIRRVKPVFYLSTEWGVPTDTVAIAIPFYLAHPELTQLHADKIGHIEGRGPADILRYLRHEMGHVLNYAYKLYESSDWVALFGSIEQPYEEEYRPDAFSRRFVRHLDGWYAQKHPDEDWAETFAVWMTPGSNWRADYTDWPVALAKLQYCDRIMHELQQRDPIVTAADLDEDVSQLAHSLDKFYGSLEATPVVFPTMLDGALRSIFEGLNYEETGKAVPRRPALGLLHSLEQSLMTEVYRWTGHFPERTRALLRHLAARADDLQLTYPVGREQQATVALTALVTVLAMNHIRLGQYLP